MGESVCKAWVSISPAYEAHCESSEGFAPYSAPHDTVGQLDLLMLLHAVHAAEMVDVLSVR